MLAGDVPGTVVVEPVHGQALFGGYPLYSAFGQHLQPLDFVEFQSETQCPTGTCWVGELRPQCPSCSQQLVSAGLRTDPYQPGSVTRVCTTCSDSCFTAPATGSACMLSCPRFTPGLAQSCMPGGCKSAAVFAHVSANSEAFFLQRSFPAANLTGCDGRGFNLELWMCDWPGVKLQVFGSDRPYAERASDGPSCVRTVALRGQFSAGAALEVNNHTLLFFLFQFTVSAINATRALIQESVVEGSASVTVANLQGSGWIVTEAWDLAAVPGDVLYVAGARAKDVWDVSHFDVGSVNSAVTLTLSEGSSWRHLLYSECNDYRAPAATLSPTSSPTTSATAPPTTSPTARTGPSPADPTWCADRDGWRGEVVKVAHAGGGVAVGVVQLRQADGYGAMFLRRDGSGVTHRVLSLDPAADSVLGTVVGHVDALVIDDQTQRGYVATGADWSQRLDAGSSYLIRFSVGTLEVEGVLPLRRSSVNGPFERVTKLALDQPRGVLWGLVGNSPTPHLIPFLSYGITSITPEQVSHTGDSVVTVHGYGFVDIVDPSVSEYRGVYCRFSIDGEPEYYRTGEVLSGTAVLCRTPKVSVSRTHSCVSALVSVSMSGGDFKHDASTGRFVDSGVALSFFEDPELLAVSPAVIVADNVTSVVVTGSGFKPTTLLGCAFYHSRDHDGVSWEKKWDEVPVACGWKGYPVQLPCYRQPGESPVCTAECHLPPQCAVGDNNYTCCADSSSHLFSTAAEYISPTEVRCTFHPHCWSPGAGWVDVSLDGTRYTGKPVPLRLVHGVQELVLERAQVTVPATTKESPYYAVIPEPLNVHVSDGHGNILGALDTRRRSVRLLNESNASRVLLEEDVDVCGQSPWLPAKGSPDRVALQRTAVHGFAQFCSGALRLHLPKATSNRDPYLFRLVEVDPSPLDPAWLRVIVTPGHPTVLTLERGPSEVAAIAGPLRKQPIVVVRDNANNTVDDAVMLESLDVAARVVDCGLGNCTDSSVWADTRQAVQLSEVGLLTADAAGNPTPVDLSAATATTLDASGDRPSQRPHPHLCGPEKAIDGDGGTSWIALGSTWRDPGYNRLVITLPERTEITGYRLVPGGWASTASEVGSMDITRWRVEGSAVAEGGEWWTLSDCSDKDRDFRRSLPPASGKSTYRFTPGHGAAAGDCDSSMQGGGCGCATRVVCSGGSCGNQSWFTVKALTGKASRGWLRIRITPLRVRRDEEWLRTEADRAIIDPRISQNRGERGRIPEGLHSIVFDSIEIVPSLHGHNYRVSFSAKPSANIEPFESGVIVSPNCSFLSLSCTAEDSCYKVLGSPHCKPCPTGGECDGSWTVEAQRGYWRPNQNTTSFTACPAPELCIGGAATGSEMCTEHHSETLCRGCEGGYGIDIASHACEECPDLVGFRVALIAMAVVGLLSLWVTLVLVSQDVPGLEGFLVIAQMTMNYLQSLNMLAGLRLPWPGVVRSMFRLMELCTLRFSSFLTIDCALREAGVSEANHSGLFLLLPLVALAVAPVSHAAQKLLRRRLQAGSHGFHQASQNTQGPSAGVSLSTSFLVVIFVSYAAITRAVADTLRCDSIEYAAPCEYPDTELHASPSGCKDGGYTVSRLRADSEVDCDGAAYQNKRVLAIFAMVFVVTGVPLLLIGTVEGSLRTQGDRGTFHYFRFLLLGTQRRFWHLQSFIMIRKALVVVALVWADDEHLQAYLIGWIMTAHLILQAQLSPYIRALHNRLETVAVCVVVVFVNLGLLFLYRKGGEEVRTLWDVFSVLVVVLTVITALVVMYPRALAQKMLARVKGREKPTFSVAAAGSPSGMPPSPIEIELSPKAVAPVLAPDVDVPRNPALPSTLTLKVEVSAHEKRQVRATADLRRRGVLSVGTLDRQLREAIQLRDIVEVLWSQLLLLTLRMKTGERMTLKFDEAENALQWHHFLRDSAVYYRWEFEQHRRSSLAPPHTDSPRASEIPYTKLVESRSGSGALLPTSPHPLLSPAVERRESSSAAGPAADVQL
eukprot:TRINITY_DN12543_c0_g1_i2.p1 TRINITY_DN12543_c0_g1~~TRINITY_DN12543_c0_g1_i2.p1  ORF type:complete len:1997 (+),score=469.33 TRINITY_DN12543_c0_g1_i2:1634-7624(+)